MTVYLAATYFGENGEFASVSPLQEFVGKNLIGIAVCN